MPHMSARNPDMQPETCHVVRVLSVSIDTPDSVSELLLREGVERGPDAVYELPTCPVCLERMDSAVTGLVTVPCSHTFHCACLSKWGDSRYVSGLRSSVDMLISAGARSAATHRPCFPRTRLITALQAGPYRSLVHPPTRGASNATARRICGYASSVAISAAVGTDALMRMSTTHEQHISMPSNWRRRGSGITLETATSIALSRTRQTGNS